MSALRDRVFLLALALAGLSAGCAARAARAPLEVGRPEERFPTVERWVDGYAVEGGNGSAEKPFKRLSDALRGPPALVHLAAGMYEGPFRLPDGTALVGSRAAVVFANGDAETVLTIDTGLLKGITVQGGKTGLFAGADVQLDHVLFSGQRVAGARVLMSASLGARGAEFDGTVSETRGVVVDPSGVAILEVCAFTGAYRRGVDVTSGRAFLDRVTFAGAVEAVHVEDGEATLRDVEIAGGRGPAVFASGSTLLMRGVQVVGHEYGVLAGRGSTLSIEGFASERAERAGISTLLSKGSLREIDVRQSGDFGGLQLLDSQLDVSGLTVQRSKSAGVLVRKGRLSLSDAQIIGVEDDGDSGGDGVHVRDAEVKLERVSVQQAKGAGLFASAVATVTGRELSCDECRFGAVVADRASKVSLKLVKSVNAGGPVISVPDTATVEIEGLTVVGNQPVVWAQCREGAKVVLSGALPAIEDRQPCVTVK